MHFINCHTYSARQTAPQRAHLREYRPVLLSSVRAQYNWTDFIIVRTWWVCQMTGNYHLNASFEHAGESSDDDDRRRLCIIHKTRRSFQSSSIAEFKWSGGITFKSTRHRMTTRGTIHGTIHTASRASVL